MVNQQFATALHIVTAMAYVDGRLVSSEALARSVFANPVTIRKFIGLLAKARVVETVRGPSGGARLCRPPASISLADVYLAVEPPRPIAERERKGDPDCPVGCRMGGIVSELSNEIGGEVVAYLRKVSLADVVERLDRAP